MFWSRINGDASHTLDARCSGGGAELYAAIEHQQEPATLCLVNLILRH
jgi:hypothetical protein